MTKAMFFCSSPPPLTSNQQPVSMHIIHMHFVTLLAHTHDEAGSQRRDSKGRTSARCEDRNVIHLRATLLLHFKQMNFNYYTAKYSYNAATLFVSLSWG